MIVFQLSASTGGTASWDGSPTTFSYREVFIPDTPVLLFLLNIALISLGGFALLNRQATGRAKGPDFLNAVRKLCDLAR